MLLAFLAMPAWGRDDSLARVQKQHELLCEKSRGDLELIKKLREAYPDAPDRDKALKEWGTALQNAMEFFPKENQLRDEHREMIKTLTSAAITRALSGAFKKTYKPDPGSVRILDDEGAAEEMRNRSYKIGDALSAEGDLYQRAVKARAEYRQLRTYLLYGGGGAAAFVVLCVIIIAPWRKEPPPEPAAAVPDALALLAGNFEVGALIGRGAMGEVFSAVDKTLNRRVALKRMRPELLAEPKDRERFLSEARLVAGLKHPNIVAIHSVAQEGGETYLVFEFVEGKTLEDVIKERGRLPWGTALSYLREICSALEFAHAKGVIHRDLKPGNIMLAPDGSLKVMDFGIAHQAGASASRMTRATSLGTPPYMSPEQELGGVSASVDLYAAAVCFYEMLTGRLPFNGPNFLAQKREEVYEPASSLAPGLGRDIDAFFKAALSPQPSGRPKSAAALHAAAQGAYRP